MQHVAAQRFVPLFERTLITPPVEPPYSAV